MHRKPVVLCQERGSSTSPPVQQPVSTATSANGTAALPAADPPCTAATALEGAARSIGVCTFVEFGAGKGYLTALLSECTGVRRLVLMDHGAFKLKADRFALLHARNARRHFA